MADRIITTEKQQPRETVIIKEKETEGTHRGNGGLISALIVIAVIILLLLILGRSFGGRSGGTTNVNVPAPSGTTGQ